MNGGDTPQEISEVQPTRVGPRGKDPLVLRFSPELLPSTVSVSLSGSPAKSSYLTLLFQYLLYGPLPTRTVPLPEGTPSPCGSPRPFLSSPDRPLRTRHGLSVGDDKGVGSAGSRVTVGSDPPARKVGLQTVSEPALSPDASLEQVLGPDDTRLAFRDPAPRLGHGRGRRAEGVAGTAGPVGTARPVVLGQVREGREVDLPLPPWWTRGGKAVGRQANDADVGTRPRPAGEAGE